MDEDDFTSWDDEDWPDAEPDADTIICPECGFEMYADVELCPHCGYFVEPAPDEALADRPRWFVVLGVLGILATVLALSGLLSLI